MTLRALTLLSLRVEALDDQLDPQLALYDSAGDLVIANDDFAWPHTREAIVQAFVAPRTGEYALAVSGFGGGGKYRLHALPGYDRLALRDTAMQGQHWTVAHSDAEVGLGASSLFAVDLDGIGRSAVILGERFPPQRDFYFELAFDYVSAVNNWQVGAGIPLSSAGQLSPPAIEQVPAIGVWSGMRAARRFCCRTGRRIRLS